MVLDRHARAAAKHGTNAQVVKSASPQKVRHSVNTTMKEGMPETTRDKFCADIAGALASHR